MIAFVSAIARLFRTGLRILLPLIAVAGLCLGGLASAAIADATPDTEPQYETEAYDQLQQADQNANQNMIDKTQEAESEAFGAAPTPTEKMIEKTVEPVPDTESFGKKVKQLFGQDEE
ncbi:MAG: hypothetical protein F6J97_05520 [Leptolyngbya sp. SIO4C1]|nr:hypothetical protein [Leptolyngbya sp. SIO4C1]